MYGLRILCLLWILSVSLGQPLNPIQLERIKPSTALRSLYKNCQYLGTSLFPGPYLLWTPVGQGYQFWMTGLNGGYIAFGVSNATGMLYSDPIMCTLTNGISDVDDYYVRDQRFPTRDTSSGGTKNVNGTYTLDAQTGITTCSWFRNVLSTDVLYDLPLKPGVPWVYIWSMSTQGDTTMYHDYARNPFTMDIAAQATCPSTNAQACSGNGLCNGGCCDCNAGFGGVDCSVVTNSNVTAVASTAVPATSGGGGLTPTINPGDYPFTTQLGSGGILYWKFDTGSVIELAIQVNALGWVGFGPSQNGGMVGSDVMWGWVDSTGVHVQDKKLLDQVPFCPGVCLDTDTPVGGTDDILDYSGSQQNGVTQIKWKRKMVTGDTKGDLDYINGPQNVVYAWHPTSTSVTQHLTSTRFQANINFASGAITINNVQDKHAAHGLLMFFCWAIFIPLGTFIARYLKDYKWWFNVHRIINSFAILLLVIAFIIAVDFSTTHFNNLHTIFGLIIVTLAFSQPIIGTVADLWFNPDREGAPIFPDMTHWVIGYVTALAGLANVAIGINEYYGYTNGVLIAFIIYGGLLATAYLCFALFKIILKYETK